MEINEIKKPSEMTTLERIKHFFFLGHVPKGYGEMFYPFRTTGGMIEWINKLLTIVEQKDEEIVLLQQQVKYLTIALRQEADAENNPSYADHVVEVANDWAKLSCLPKIEKE